METAPMIFRVCPSVVVSAIVSCVFASACSSTPATARAFVSASLSAGATKGQCTVSANTPSLTIGTIPASPMDTVVRAGSGGDTNITCSVKSASGGFDINIEAIDNSTQVGQGGSLLISGHVTPSTATTEGGGTNITVDLNAAGTGTYTETDCTISFDFATTNALPPAPPNVAAGRIWGHVQCPNASTTSNGGTTFCVASADFVFENCTE
jgi:hypothetical protein